MDIFLNEIIDLVDGNLVCGENTTLDTFSINTKDINEGDIFVGIKGEKIDGSKFYKDALNQGAKGVIINKGYTTEKIRDKFILEVEDTVLALQKIASYKRDKLNIPVVGITGSVGKTSTKDMISSVLETKYSVCKTKGNLNNHIGLPLTILSLKNEDVLVVEMGMNHLGEISTLSKIAKPTISVITNVGTAHIGNLGSRENILKAKLEILDGMENGKLIINNDNDMLHDWNEKEHDNRVVTIGINNESDYIAKNIMYSNETTFDYDNEKIVVKVGGEAFVYNALMGIAVGKLLDINIEDIKQGISSLKLTNNRLEIIDVKGYKIINDCYNANFDSVKEGLHNLNKYNGRKIAVLGDMLELGNFTEDLHRKVGQEVNNTNIDILVTVGENAKYINEETNIENYHFDTNIDAINYLKSIIKENDNILIKASNGMNFIEIVNSLKEE